MTFFQLSVLKKRAKEEKEEKASQGGWEGRREGRKWRNKRTKERQLLLFGALRKDSTLWWVFPTGLSGQILKLTWIFTGAYKNSPLNLLGAIHRSTSHPALARVAKGCPPLPWLSSLSTGLWNNPWGALLKICSPLLKATNKYLLKYSEQYLHKYSFPWLEG